MGDEWQPDWRKKAHPHRNSPDRVPLYLGHYDDCFFLIADYQVSDYANDLPRVRNAVWEVALDWLAVGLDPERSSFIVESLVPEHAELTAWFGWSPSIGMLERNPTLKAEMKVR